MPIFNSFVVAATLLLLRDVVRQAHHERDRIL